jgi:hypothetical protein
MLSNGLTIEDSLCHMTEAAKMSHLKNHTKIPCPVQDVLDDSRENGEVYSAFGIQCAYGVPEEVERLEVLPLKDLLMVPKTKPVTTS